MAYKSDLIKDNIEEYLDQHEDKELLRFTTVGSVDDGKSTLIGRLLYDTGEVYEDQLDAARKATTKDAQESGVDLALITDGLRAEREQGITIDVAYRYFTTARRKFIIADTPGHVQYTRNMATGASTADVAIILIDARLGVLEQSRRHAYIANLLKIPNLLVAVNKLDIKDYSEQVFNDIKADFQEFAKTLDFEEIAFFPVSALVGDNIVNKSDNTPWYDGQTILDYLETVPLRRNVDENQLTFPVQYVIRPDLNFRGFAGTIASGVMRKGYEVVALPSGKKSRIKSIHLHDQELEEAFAPLSVIVTLEDEIDISRGDMIVYPETDLHVSRQITADIVWMNENKLELGKQYMIKHTSNNTTCTIGAIDHKTNMATLEHEEADGLELNEIGQVQINLARPMIVDLYKNSRQAGAFILIDRMTNATLAAGMINGFGLDEKEDLKALANGVKQEERAQRFGQKPCVIWLTGRSGAGKIFLANALERRLFEAGHVPYLIDPRSTPGVTSHATGDELSRVVDYAEVCLQAGLVVISPFTAPTAADRAAIRERLGDAYVEVFVEADVDTSKVRIELLGGNPDSADAPYEDPENPDLAIRTDDLKLNEEVDKVVALLRSRDLLS